MDRSAAAALHSELYLIAAGQPGKGPALMERVYVICQALYESDPRLELLEQLRSLQALMLDWISPEGWQLHGEGPAVLRELLMESITEVAELTSPCSDTTAMPHRTDTRMPRPALTAST